MSTSEGPITPRSKWLQFLQQNLSPLAIPMPTGGKSTLTEYIDENGKLLSALGLFLGLSVFANNLAEKGRLDFSRSCSLHLACWFSLNSCGTSVNSIGTV